MSKLWNPARVQRAERFRMAPDGWELAVGFGEPTPDADSFAAGYAEARRVVEAEVAAERAMLPRVIDAAGSLAPADPEPLAALLAEAVLRLVGDIVGQVPVDAKLLRERALALSSAIHEPDGPLCLLVHPDGALHLKDLPEHIQVRADHNLKPGDVRVQIGDGHAEDGVAAAFDRLRTAIAELGLDA